MQRERNGPDERYCPAILLPDSLSNYLVLTRPCLLRDDPCFQEDCVPRTLHPFPIKLSIVRILKATETGEYAFIMAGFYGINESDRGTVGIS